MKQDWQVTGTLAFTDSSFSQMSASWPALTYAEANEKVEALVRQEMRKKKVHGITVEAVSRSKNSFSMLKKAEFK